MPDLSRIGEREKLKPKAGDEPHWQRLRQGVYLGYRPSKKKVGGTWFARFYDPEANRNIRKRLGDYGTLSGHDVFKQAKADAEMWAETVESGGELARNMVTVKDACEAYLIERPGSIAAGVFRRHVYSDQIAKVKLDKLRRHHLKAWRKRLEQAPALVTRTKDADKKRMKERSKSTVNRDMVPLRAALSLVLKLGAPNTDAAWQEALRPFKGADKRRELYLDRDERKKLIDATCEEACAFVKGMCLLPLRPGALAGLKVRDFDKRTRALIVGKDKNGNPRQLTMPQTIADFFEEQVKGKLPAASIFARTGGEAWNKDAWKYPIKEAVKAVGLPGAASAYTLRHSVITDLIRARLPILTVAQLSGTSVAMIEKHYGHLVRDDAEEALASIAV
ncbi:tyrosine-type recombinase/integrase [Altererythrobacter endophyticus]|uniref:Tyrosine-type recombinase/integrase n=2 Tax=Altericroceibacterium endophyticum TaxID=1808508 RepID=A0A6I4T7D2_9SPHN|nr:tyrosine-type recombinase/integrase [Altericroceibacterium endophyticum]MXO66588.1 tyrosine-type recombinase/integrase [Altericroceibacterium endophyticum]